MCVCSQQEYIASNNCERSGRAGAEPDVEGAHIKPARTGCSTAGRDIRRLDTFFLAFSGASPRDPQRAIFTCILSFVPHLQAVGWVESSESTYRM